MVAPTRIRLLLRLLLGVVLLLLGLTVPVPHGRAQSQLPNDYVPDELLVAIKPEYMVYLRTQALTPQESGIRALDRVNQRLGVVQMTPLLEHTSEEKGALSRVFKIKLPPRSNVQEALAAFQGQPFVEYAEPNYIYRALWEPNDPMLNDQWALSKIAAFQAWELSRGSKGVIIAIPDTGVDYNHPDLRDKVLTDRDYDFVNNDTDAMDDHGHGTHVAGIAAAATNNGQGIAGVCPECTILPIKVLDSMGLGNADYVAIGIQHAVKKGAKIINLSLGGNGCSTTLAKAIDEAFERGVLIIAASGNSGNKTTLYYPASSPRVLSVGATDANDQETFYSNRSTDLDILAPGEGILSTLRNDIYGRQSGTSMAAPHVAGAAGLLWSLHPEWKQTQIWWVLRYSTDLVTLYDSSYSLTPAESNVPANWQIFLPFIMKGGLGRLNLYKALQVVTPQEFIPPPELCSN